MIRGQQLLIAIARATGVTVTASSPSMLGQQSAVTSDTGNYRLPPRAARIGVRFLW